MVAGGGASHLLLLVLAVLALASSYPGHVAYARGNWQQQHYRKLVTPSGGHGFSYTSTPEVLPGRFLVKLRPKSGAVASRSAGAIQSRAAKIVNKMREKKLTVRVVREYSVAFDGFSLQTGDNPKKVLDELEDNYDVLSFYPVVWISAPGSNIADLDSNKLRGVYSAWTSASPTSNTSARLAATGRDRLVGSSVKVGIIDTGVDYTHPALAGKVRFQYDFVGNDYGWSGVPAPKNDSMDCAGHGTHVAGIVAGNYSLPGSSFNYTGIAPGVTLGGYKVFGCNGSTTSEIVVAAMDRAAQDGMQIINLSVGEEGAFQGPVADAAARLTSMGIMVVAAVGNAGAYGLFMPTAAANSQSAIAVASIQSFAAPATLKLRVMMAPAGAGLSGGSSGNGGGSDSRYDIKAAFGNVSQLVTAPIRPTNAALSNGSAASNASADGCSPDPTLDLSGTVALLALGGCLPDDKISNAVTQKAIGVILYGDDAAIDELRRAPLSRSPASWYGSPSSPFAVPVVAVDTATGIDLFKLYPRGVNSPLGQGAGFNRTRPPSAASNSSSSYGWPSPPAPPPPYPPPPSPAPPSPPRTFSPPPPTAKQPAPGTVNAPGQQPSRSPVPSASPSNGPAASARQGPDMSSQQGGNTASPSSPAAPGRPSAPLPPPPARPRLPPPAQKPQLPPPVAAPAAWVSNPDTVPVQSWNSASVPSGAGAVGKRLHSSRRLLADGLGAGQARASGGGVVEGPGGDGAGRRHAGRHQGRELQQLPGSPVRLPVIADVSGSLASFFSSWGPSPELRLKPTVAAPGGAILSSVPVALSRSGFAYLSGTSQAAPYVTGALALAMEALRSRNVTPGQLEAYLVTTSVPLRGVSDPAPATQPPGLPVTSALRVGAGVVDIAALVNNQVDLNITRVDMPNLSASYGGQAPFLADAQTKGLVTRIDLGSSLANGGSPSFLVDVNNRIAAPLTFQLVHVPAASVDASTQMVLDPVIYPNNTRMVAPYDAPLAPPAADVTFLTSRLYNQSVISTINVSANSRARFNVTFNLAKSVGRTDQLLFSGYLMLVPVPPPASADSSDPAVRAAAQQPPLCLPYMGYSQPLTSMPLLLPALPGGISDPSGVWNWDSNTTGLISFDNATPPPSYYDSSSYYDYNEPSPPPSPPPKASSNLTYLLNGPRASLPTVALFVQRQPAAQEVQLWRASDNRLLGCIALSQTIRRLPSGQPFVFAWRGLYTDRSLGRETTVGRGDYYILVKLTRRAALNENPMSAPVETWRTPTFALRYG